MGRAKNQIHTIKKISKQFSSVNLKRRRALEDTCVRENINEMYVYEMGVPNKPWIQLTVDRVKRWAVLTQLTFVPTRRRKFMD
jgi:hypothetical protein